MENAANMNRDDVITDRSWRQPRWMLGNCSRGRGTITVKRVFGEPIERNGMTVIPVAKVGGGGGGGSAPEPLPSGGGFGDGATPAGVFVIKGSSVAWQPALDLNRVVLGGQLVAIVLLLVIRAIIQSRANDGRRERRLSPAGRFQSPSSAGIRRE